MNRIKELRDERNLSTRGMSIKTNINNISITRYENEQRDISTSILKELASFFEVTIDYLLCYSGFCLYVTYEKGNVCFRINDDYYKEIKEKGFIYINKFDKRCININSMLGLSDDVDITSVLFEAYRIKKANLVFEKKKVSLEEIALLNEEIIDIELTRDYIDFVREMIK